LGFVFAAGILSPIETSAFFHEKLFGIQSSHEQADVEIEGESSNFSGDTGYYTVSGKVVNRGSDASDPITIAIKIYDINDSLLYSGTTSPQHNVLQPQQEVNFSAKIDLREYADLYNGTASSQPSLLQPQLGADFSELLEDNYSKSRESEPFVLFHESTVITPDGTVLYPAPAVNEK
jgi:hypothetical protein